MKRRNQNAPARSADFLTPFTDEIRLQTSGVTVVTVSLVVTLVVFVLLACLVCLRVA